VDFVRSTKKFLKAALFTLGAFGFPLSTPPPLPPNPPPKPVITPPPPPIKIAPLELTIRHKDCAEDCSSCGVYSDWIASRPMED